MQPTRLCRHLLAAVLPLALATALVGCDLVLSSETKVKKSIAGFANAIHGSHWKSAATFCDASQMTWTYYSGSKSYTLKGDKAVNGFLASINKMENRDGFYIDATTVRASDTKAAVSGTIRIPICYNRITMTYGKVLVPCQLTLIRNKQGRWVISNITESSERQKG